MGEAGGGNSAIGAIGPTRSSQLQANRSMSLMTEAIRPSLSNAALTDPTQDAKPGGLARPSPGYAERVQFLGRDRLSIGLAYALAWGALLVNRGLYWDDWTLVGLSPAALARGSWEIGMPWVGYLLATILSMPLPGLVGHVLVFCTYLLSTLVLHAILIRAPSLSRMDALVAALTFAVFPVNYARVALVDLPYGVSLLAFLVATWLLLRYLEVGGLARRLAALCLYLCSFSTASLLVLYVAPMALAAFIGWKSARTPVRSFVARHADFVALPVIYWLLKSAFFTPSGVYEGYNALTLQGLTQVPQALPSIPFQVLLEPLYRAITVAGLLGVVVGAGAAVWLRRRSRVIEPCRFVSAPVLSMIGVAILGLGVFAYLSVGHVPTIWDWSSRHQLLVPLGVGLLAAAAVRGLNGTGRVGPALGVTVGLLLGVSVVADARTLVAYQTDWFKQAALIDAARTIPALRTARHIRVTDSSTAFNAVGRTYRFYEYNALLSEAVGDTRRLVSDGLHEPSLQDIGQFISRPAYHMDEYVPSPIDLELRVSSPRGYPDGLQVLRLVVLEALGSPSFEQEVSQLIEVRATPVVGSGPVP